MYKKSDKSILFITYEYPRYTPYGGIAFYYSKTADILSNLGITVVVYTAKVGECSLNSVPKSCEMRYFVCNNGDEFYSMVYKTLKSEKLFFDIIEVPHFGAPFLEQLNNGKIKNHCRLFTVRVHGSTLLTSITNNLKYYRFFNTLRFFGNNFFIDQRVVRLLKLVDLNLYGALKSHIRESLLIAKSDVVSTTSNLMRDNILRNRISKSVVPVVFDNPSQFEVKKNYNNQHKLKIVYANRLQYLKGFDLFTEAISKSSIGEKVDVEVFGEDLMGVTRKLKFKESENLNYFGRVDSRFLSNAMYNADIVVIPSRFESYSNVTIESMSNSCIVVVSSWVGFKDNIKDGYNGFIFKSGSVISLKKTLEKIINLSPYEIKRLKRNAHLTAMELSRNGGLKKHYSNLIISE